MLDIAINENERSGILEWQTFPFHFSEWNGMEQNGKNTFTLTPRKVVERLEWFSLCSVNAV